MYCVKCGVNLADTEKSCPLCGTAVYHPELTQENASPLYPPRQYPAPRNRSKSWLIILTTAFLLPILITLQCDLLLNGKITWSGFVIGALVTLYTFSIFPFWFSKRNIAWVVGGNTLVIAAYLFYINYAVGGSWFYTFALPVTLYFGLLLTGTLYLLKKQLRWILSVLGGSSIALGLFMPVMEYLIYRTFSLSKMALWSLYPLTVLLLLGAMFLFLHLCRPARESMERKFFL